MPILVVHLAVTPLAGSPIRIVRAVNHHSDIRARLIVLQPDAYGNRTFGGDLNWQTGKQEALELLCKADIVHVHHFFDLDDSPFGVNFFQVCRRAQFVRQFHTHPLTIARGDETRARLIVNSTIPQLVIGQHHERFYPRARIVPNIVPLADERYGPTYRNGSDPVLFFAPTVDNSAWDIPEGCTRWETKGAPETESLLYRVVKSCGKGRVLVRRNIPHEQCLQEKQASDIVIDEMVTGSFHLASLEALAQGLPTFAYLDARTLDTLAELTGTHEHPWLNFRLEDAERPLRDVIHDAELRRELGECSRKWMETYYSDHEMVQHYVRAYRDLLERPDDFQKLRFDTTSRRITWLAQRRDEIVWECRRARFAAPLATVGAESRSAAATPPSETIREIADWIGVGTERWLNNHRTERMDALDTTGVFQPARRAFHRSRYNFAVNYAKGLEVADIACGLGYGCRILKEGGAKTVVGIDRCPEAVQYANSNHGVDGVRFTAGDATHLPLASSSVDAIISFETLEHVPDTNLLLTEFHRVLRPEGRLIVSSPNDWGLTEYHCHSWTPFELSAEIAAVFEIESTWEQLSNSGAAGLVDPNGIRSWSKATEREAECLIVIGRKVRRAPCG